MEIIKCGVREFEEQTRDKKVYCYGVTNELNSLLLENQELMLAKRITAVVSLRKLNVDSQRTLLNSPPIINYRRFKEDYQNDPNIVLLIMDTNIKEAWDLLKASGEIFDSLKVYHYPLFMFYDHFTELPQALLDMRQGEACIPKRIHYCWFGSGEISDRDKAYIEGWKKIMPDYEIVFWNEDNYDVYKHPYTAEAYKDGAYAFVSDYARLDIIYNHGGIYMDTDVEVLKPFDDLLYSDSFFGFSHHGLINTGQGFGAAPGTQIVKEMRDIYDGAVYVHNQMSRNSPIETLSFNRRGYVSGNRFFISGKDVIYPVEFFAPMSIFYGLPTLSDNCYSIHRYNWVWLDQKNKTKRLEMRKYYESIWRGENL
jgi:hypothetical protein